MPNDTALPISQVLKRIEEINERLNGFWNKTWCRVVLEASETLGKSRLDWQADLSRCLQLWLQFESKEDVDGELILAWANLGSLLEGTLKTYLCARYEVYKEDIEEMKKAPRAIEEVPDAWLETLRQVFEKKVFTESDEKHWNKFISRIQERRNAIHTFKGNDIGSFDEFFQYVRKYLRFLEFVDNRLPYREAGEQP